MDKWLIVLIQATEENGVRPTAARLGVSPATVSQIRNRRYGLSDNLRARVAEVFGREEIPCPALGRIGRARCISNHRLAVRVGGRATGNPETLRLFRACLSCNEWDGGFSGDAEEGRG